MDIQRNNRLFPLRVKQRLGTLVSAAAKAMIVLATIGSLETYAQSTQKPGPQKPAHPQASAGRSTGSDSGAAVASRKVTFASARPAQRPVATKTSARSTVATKHSQKVSPVGRQSVISKAAHGEIIAEPLPEVLHQGHMGHHGHVIEAGCGVEGCTTCCDSGPVIGTPLVGGPACGIEPGCGLEPGCGMEACATCGPTMYGIAPLGCDTMMCEPGCDSMACGPTAGWFNECYPIFVPIKRINWSNFEFFAGTHAFSGPANFAGTVGPQINRDGTASFGIHEGFNFARPSFLLGGGISSQFGLRATHSNASGAEFTPDSRNQIFLTGGFFRRVDYGLQGGVVVDYLNDKWYYNASLTQLRAQIGWKHDPCNEFGYIWTGGLGDDVTTGTVNLGAGGAQQINVNLEPVDQHRIFYRRYFKKGGPGELFAGTTDESDGLLGASLDIPLIDGISMRTSMVYLNPNLSGSQVDSQEETWNLSWGFVWYPCGTCARSPYDRPMFEVADNGSFMMDRLSIP